VAMGRVGKPAITRHQKGRLFGVMFACGNCGKPRRKDFRLVSSKLTRQSACPRVHEKTIFPDHGLVL
jgi:hypothetical protein